ncbi:MAG: trigger factor [Actinomycetota bacterium]
MQTTVETTEKHTVKLTIEVPADEYAKDLDAAYRSIANQVKIPGFRKGKIPKQIIDAQIGADVVRDEFIQAAVPSYYRQAISDEDLAPISDPEIDLDDEFDVDRPLVFTAVVEVRPRLELTEADYKGVKVMRPSTEVTDQEVDDWVNRLRERFAELEPAERPVQDGDFTTIDVKATADGEEIDGLARTDYLYFVGSGEFGPTLDAEIVGKKAGDILKVAEEITPSAGEELAGKNADMTILVKDVKARILPEPDDGFAKTASEFDTIDQLRDDLRTRLGELKEREAEGVVRDRALQAMIDAVEVDLPESLVEDETDHRVAHAKERAERAGLTIDQLLEAQGWDEARLREDSRDHAVRAITSDLVLEGIARSEDLEVTADEIGAEIAQLAQAYDREPKDLAKQLDRSGQIVTLAGDIIRGKALDLLVEHADIETETETESPEAGAEADAAEASSDDEPANA